ncbi:porin family protein [Parapedobacter koreensis]|uniref:Outer membrane protein beta-barrel domain-containing protein n=1 Tax=Parapedobacter koreensis TaxID=332977 RepID=A0A1H7MSA7_9SPHI|nr:porin family protein [Parapedobacter koreensis]SEL14142.1 Outer membrane protein beta-barrel domain-containing protein [Parapedobacter koreensis]
MSTKALVSLFVFIFISVSCFAQVKWDVKAGLNYSNITAKDRDGNKANTSSQPGIYLGLGAGVRLSSQFSIQPSFIYARRGFKQEGSSHIGWGEDFQANVSYLELPVDLLYSPKIGPGNLLLAVGPYLGYGTGGKWKTKGTVLIGDIVIDGNGEVAFQNDNSYGGMNTYVYARPWDYGAHFRIGYSIFNQYTLSFDIQQGIADLQPRWADYQPSSTVRNRSMGVSVGYSF